MSLKKFTGTLLACQFAVFPTLAQAQSSDFNQPFARQGTEARMSFTIPLGNSIDKKKTAPRLNFGVRNYTTPSTSSIDWMRADINEFKEVRLGFTLEEKPQLMMNEQVLIFPEDEQANIGTAGKIGLGVAAVALVGVAAIGVIFLTYEDDYDD